MTPFTKAKRENVNLLVGLVGGTGGGKTKSAFELAHGICGDNPFAVIDTEARRALHYADAYNFDHAELLPPFTPERYLEVILAAEKAGYKAIVIDSMSHEHEGEGGLLDMQEAELQRMAGDNYAKREQCLQASWIKPKRAHKKMVQRLLQVRAHLIICMRAEDKTELKRVDGKLMMVPKLSLTGVNGWIPICEKRLPFELTASFLVTADAPGMPKPIKLQDQHRALFPLDQPITEQSGKMLAVWASGTKAAPLAVLPPEQPTGAAAVAASYITANEALALEARCKENGINVASLKKAAGVERLSLITPAALPRAHAWIDAAIIKRKNAEETAQ